MIIVKMHASFGKLNGEITLHEGLNLLCLPNEAGKSTWSAFLIAMLYGIDTSEKSSAANQHLPMKERYKPWDGRSMQGRIELIHNGRRITIERRTQKKIPMGVFEAYDTDTGTPIPELNGDNCGKMLCGVERSVFERTAFIRQLGLSVTEDSALEKRMNALVTTGEEGKSASDLERKLHDWEVKLSKKPTGRIHRLSAQIDKLAQELTDLHTLQDDAMLLRAQSDAAQKELSHLNALTQRIERAKNAKKHLALEELTQKNAAQELKCKHLQAQVSLLPEEAQLHSLRQQLEQASSALHTAQLEHAFTTEPPSKPQPPACFVGLSAMQARQKHSDDASQYRSLNEAKAPKKTGIFLCAAIILLGAALCFVNLYFGLASAAGGVLALIFSLILYAKKIRAYQNSKHQAELILSRYGVDHIDKTALIVQEYASQMQRYETALSAYNEKSDEQMTHLRSAETQMQAVLAQIKCFSPSCNTLDQGKEAIRAALELHARFVSEKRTLELQRSQLFSMQQLVGNATGDVPDPEALSLDESKIIYEKNAAAERLMRLNAKLSEQNGKISATGDAAVLQAKLEECRLQLAEAKRLEHVLDIAKTALKSADEALRSRFSPQITAEAARILSELTEGKYSSVLLKPNMQLSVREQSDPVMHPAAAMSCGTADQMYLALRLAMVRRLLPENAPIILDDALVNFDDKRTAAALKLLSAEAKNRQIILFSCKEIPYVL
ncbi:MAG: hypothetical protein E7434_03490 [Ruminococcaceae bacterium]|nr:hypothetical protein [Oscillospiraceae bacterium]